ncbi:MAG: AAA family ATPase [bacterium]|nr:AAA family ATPase [bacterium]
MTDDTGSIKTKKLPVGISDFRIIIEENFCYVDKSLFIKELLDRGDSIILIPRPRRFGKTLNLSMLKYFYDCVPGTLFPGSEPPPKPTDTTGDSNKKLFQSLAIIKAGSKYLDKMGKHPVIFLSFRSIKELDWDSCYSKLKQLIRKEYAKHDYLIKGNTLTSYEQVYFKKILELKGDKGDYENSLENLLFFLNRYYGKRVVILIDEYDAPIHAGHTHGYYEKIINFMRNFLCGGLKDTDEFLEKCVLTGIMRVAKESIFSGLNNPGIYTLLSEEFSDKFGFTENEVESLLHMFQRSHLYDDVKEWYNGYRFGSRVIYNPWSIINFLGRSSEEPEPYWLNTSDNQIIDTLLSNGGKELRVELELLIRGESIEKVVDENIILKQVASREDFLWSFLLMGGYLKQTGKRRDPGSGKVYYKLSIPNLEVRIIYSQIIDIYFTGKIGTDKVEIMLKALIDGDIKLFEKMLRKVVTAVFSYHDFGAEPEKVYHALVAGMLIWISNTHEIKSNRESGYGRYDIMIIPRDIKKIGYVIEFKSVDPEDNETTKSALTAALKQIEDKKYDTELTERGIKNIKKLAIAFSGKDVTVKEAGEEKKIKDASGGPSGG